MSLGSGTQLGHYEILSLLGAGGMGEVYRARDTKLNREVALKVLPETFARDPERMARFEREAQVLASLNHPNIAQIYGLEESGETRALVMELVEGPTLAERIAAPTAAHRAALQLDETLAIAKQIADALEAAHDKNIIHRDLKPANIKVKPDGVVKVLDFGLAKAMDVSAAPVSGGQAGETPALQNSPTLSLTAQAGFSPQPTRAGMILGTAAYMSPEQAKGLAVDRRTDIWAFGCVLYEMMTGKRAFEGETLSDVLASVIKEEPDWTAIPETTPQTIQRLIRRCLTKDLKHRLQAIGEARITIEATMSGTPDAGAGLETRPYEDSARIAGHRSALQRALPWAAVVIVAVAIGYFARARIGGNGGGVVPTFDQLTFRQGPISAARFAPDGKTYIYAAAWDNHAVELYSATLGSPESRSLNLPGANLLAVSSTGELAVSLRATLLAHNFYRGTLAQAPLAGGAPREILDNVEWADWSPGGSKLAVVQYVDGERELEYPIGKVLYKTSGWISHIRISPNGREIAFLDHPVYPDDRGSVAVINLEGRKTVLSTGWESEEGLSWSASGKEVWFTAAKAGTGRELYAVSLGGELRRVASVPGDMTLEDILTGGAVLLTRDTERLGIMGLAAGEKHERNLTWLGWSIPTDISSDGKTLLFTEASAGAGSLYAVCVRPVDGESSPVVLGKGSSETFSPDGKWVLSVVPSSPEELVMLPTGAGSEKVLPAGRITHYSFAKVSWFPGGKRILVTGRAAGHGYRCYIQNVNGGEPKPVTPEGTTGQVISPDGKQILVRDSGGKYWIYPVAGGKPQPVPGLGAKDLALQWSADGRSLFIGRGGTTSATIYRFDLASGKRQLWKALTPAVRSGLLSVVPAVVTRSGNAYAYFYATTLSDLYLAKGLH